MQREMPWKAAPWVNLLHTKGVPQPAPLRAANIGGALELLAVLRLVSTGLVQPMAVAPQPLLIIIYLGVGAAAAAAVAAVAAAAADGLVCRCAGLFVLELWITPTIAPWSETIRDQYTLSQQSGAAAILNTHWTTWCSSPPPLPPLLPRATCARMCRRRLCICRSRLC